MTAFVAGLLLSLSLIIAIGPQNAHVLRMGLLRSHVGVTVLACALTDLALIALGVAGLAQLGALPRWAHLGLMSGAILFLLYYAARAAQRVWRNPYQQLREAGAGEGEGAFKVEGAAEQTNVTQLGAPQNRRQALATALAFSWLNPHAWLDTAVLIGTASLAYAPSAHWQFGSGAAVGSALWFAALAYAAQRLAPHLQNPTVWRGIDALITCTMSGTALWLLVGLLQ
jgi:L-lysine exporter family protein LysE/ArgO